MNNEQDFLRKKCWKDAFFSFATAWIFEKRASRLRWKLKVLTFLGIAVPIAGWGIISCFKASSTLLNSIIVIGGILGTIQLIGSVWALVSKWDDEYAYSLESTSSNYLLCNKYKELGENPPGNTSEFKIKIDNVDLENRVRTDSDYKHQIGEKEKRMGHRAALRQFKIACEGCKIIPKSMKPSDCDICGRF